MYPLDEDKMEAAAMVKMQQHERYCGRCDEVHMENLCYDTYIEDPEYCACEEGNYPHRHFSENR